MHYQHYLLQLAQGLTLASLTNVFPQLIIISQYKVLISFITLIILLVAGVIIKNQKPCHAPVDPNLRTIWLKNKKKLKNSILLICYNICICKCFYLPDAIILIIMTEHPDHNKQLASLKRIEGQLEVSLIDQ